MRVVYSKGGSSRSIVVELLVTKGQSVIHTASTQHGDCYNYGSSGRKDFGSWLGGIERDPIWAISGLGRRHKVWQPWCDVTWCDDMGYGWSDFGGKLYACMEDLPDGSAVSWMSGPCCLTGYARKASAMRRTGDCILAPYVIWHVMWDMRINEHVHELYS